VPEPFLNPPPEPTFLNASQNMYQQIAKFFTDRLYGRTPGSDISLGMVPMPIGPGVFKTPAGLNAARNILAGSGRMGSMLGGRQPNYASSEMMSKFYNSPEFQDPNTVESLSHMLTDNPASLLSRIDSTLWPADPGTQAEADALLRVINRPDPFGEMSRLLTTLAYPGR